MSAFVPVVPARNLKRVHASLVDTLVLMNTTANHFISIGATNEAAFCDSVVKRLRKYHSSLHRTYPTLEHLLIPVEYSPAVLVRPITPPPIRPLTPPRSPITIDLNEEEEEEERPISMGEPSNLKKQDVIEWLERHL